MDIGFIGLGNMGGPMAANLAKGGYDVTGYDIATRCTEGLYQGASVVDAATSREVVITMLPDGDVLRSVATEIIPVMTPGSVLLDCTTADLSSTISTSQVAARNGLEYMDAPVSGGIGGARAGTLTFMAGGSRDTFKRVNTLLDVMGGRVIHCGKVGAGQTAKMCNNMILGANMIATCEAFALARKLDLDARVLHEVVSNSSGFSWVSNVYTPIPSVGPESPADNSYQAGFSAGLMLKDLRLAQEAARDVNASTPMGTLAEEYYTEFVETDGKGHMDFSAVILKLAASAKT